MKICKQSSSYLALIPIVFFLSGTTFAFPEAQVIRKALEYQIPGKNDLITFGTINKEGTVTLWRSPVDNIHERVQMGDFPIGEQLACSNSEDTVFLIYKDKQPLWRYSTTVGEPVPVMMTRGMSRVNVAHMLKVAGGDKLVALSKEWLNDYDPESYAIIAGIKGGVTSTAAVLTTYALAALAVLPIIALTGDSQFNSNQSLPDKVADVDDLNFFDDIRDVIFYPTIEELIFRTLLQGGLTSTIKFFVFLQNRNWPEAVRTAQQVARIIASTVFGAVHLYEEGGTIQALYAGLSAYFITSKLYNRYGLTAAISEHMTSNAIITFLPYIPYLLQARNER